MFKTCTVNVTLKVPEHNVIGLEQHLEEHFKVVSYKIMPNTENMYLEDEGFKKLIKMKKKLGRDIGEYINSNNYKYRDE